MKLNFYGCSFSDGGGMDRWLWFQGIKDEDWVASTWRKRILKQGYNESGFIQLLFKFKDLNKFSTLVGKKLDCDVGDYAYTANNNQNIRDMVWKNIKEDNGKIHIVQWSICERRKLWYEKTEKFYRIQGDPYTPVAFEENTERARELKDLQKRQSNYLKYYFNIDYEMQKVIMYTELLHSYAYDKGHHIYFMFHDTPNNRDDFPITIEPSANVITFNGLHLGAWIDKNKLTIEEESKGLIDDDGHYSREGNLLIADKVIETLRNDNLI